MQRGVLGGEFPHRSNAEVGDSDNLDWRRDATITRKRDACAKLNTRPSLATL